MITTNLEVGPCSRAMDFIQRTNSGKFRNMLIVDVLNMQSRNVCIIVSLIFILLLGS